MADVQGLIAQVATQAGAVILIVALLRMVARRVTGADPSGDALLALNLIANAVITAALLLQGGANLADARTYGVFALVSLGATIAAHGSYDLVASRAKGGKSEMSETSEGNGTGGVPAPDLPTQPQPQPLPRPVPTFPPGAPSLAALGLPETS